MKKIILVGLLLPLLAFQCMDKNAYKNFVEVDNQLPVDIYCFPVHEFQGTDWSYLNKDFMKHNYGPYTMKAKRKKRLFYQPFGLKKVWLTDTLQILVVEQKVYNEHDWSYIDSNNLILRKLAFTYEDIINNGCKITIKYKPRICGA